MMHNEDWTIKILGKEDDEYEAFDGDFRKISLPGSENGLTGCLEYALFRHTDSCRPVVKIQIFPKGIVRSGSSEPCMVRVNHDEKLIEVGILKPSPSFSWKY